VGLDRLGRLQRGRMWCFGWEGAGGETFLGAVGG
jgi:hypothetical protein